jgi:hypothetical protein
LAGFQVSTEDRQIKTTLKTVFKLDTDDPAAVRRPDFLFVLGDATSSSTEESSRYLLVEIKGPDQPLTQALQMQAVRDAKTLLKARPGSASVVLLGTEVAPSDAPDTEASGDNYQFRSMTYERLLARARFRLSYMLDAAKATEAEEIARNVMERELDELAGVRSA